MRAVGREADLIGLVSLWEETPEDSLESQRAGYMRKWWEGSHLQARRRALISNNNPGTMISDFQPPEQWVNTFLLFKPPDLWYCYSSPSRLTQSASQARFFPTPALIHTLMMPSPKSWWPRKKHTKRGWKY